MKRAAARFLSVLCLLSVLAVSLTFSVSAESATVADLSRANAVYLYQIENDRVLISQNTDRPIFPASTVKIMTGLLAVEALQGRYAETVTVTQEMVNAASGFRMYLNPGENVTVEQMLYAGLCAGYNDACMVLACLVAGSVDAFVAQMNVRAAELGMTSTVYTNPTGMHHDRMMTTADDLAKLALVAMENEAYMEIVSTVKYTMAANGLAPSRTFYNRNFLLARNVTARYYHGAATGMNAGTTTEGGYCIVATAEEEGLRYLCIVMGADEDSAEMGGTVYSYQIANDLLDFALYSHGMVKILAKDTVISRAEVSLSDRQGDVALVPREDVSAYLPTDLGEDELEYRVMLTEEPLKAPLSVGDTVGFVTVTHRGSLIATVELCVAEDVEQSAFLVALDRISAFTADRFFWLSCGYAAVFLLGYFVLLPYLRKRKNRKRAKYF